MFLIVNDPCVAGFEVGIAGLADVGVLAHLVRAGAYRCWWVAGVGDRHLVERVVGLEHTAS